MDPADVSAGLVLPSAAVAMLGSGGAAATLLLIFMAVTSAMSAELIAVSSIWTYDIYQTYIDPSAKGKKLIYMSHASCIVYALIMAAFSTGLHYAGISMGYLYLMMGVIISGAVLPASLTLLWDRQSWAAATLTPPLALVCSLIAWLVTAKKEGGDLSVASTGANNPMLAGNVVSLLTPVILSPLLSFALRDAAKYDWQSMLAIRKADDSDLAAAAHIDLEAIPGQAAHSAAQDAAEQTKLRSAAKLARTLTVVLTLCLLVLWPMPMYGSGYIFSKPFFTGWVAVGILWMFCSAFCVGVYPVWEGRKTSSRTLVAIFKDLTGQGFRRGPVTHGQAAMVATVDEKEEQEAVKKTATPPEVEVESR